MSVALALQIALLAYHQVTTGVDLHPFNGARNYSAAERRAEMAANGLLMGLAPIGFAFDIRWLMVYGAYYYFVLLAVEIVVWWIPYLCAPRGRWRTIYNGVLAVATSNFAPGDTLGHWLAIHERLHRETLAFLPRRAGRITPNLEHVILHLLTLVTAVVTFRSVHA